MSSIYYNKKDSFNEFGLKIENVPPLSSTNAKYDTISIPGSENGSVNIFDGYEDNSIPFNFVFKSQKEEFIYKKANIIAWLNLEVSNELIYSLYPSIFYRVKKISLSDFKTTSQIVRRFTATFTFDPLTYLLDGSDIIEISKATKISNGNATHASKPYLKIFGNGDVTIYINSQSIILKNVEEYIEIDSLRNNCYKTINTIIINQNNRMYSAFPILEVGQNTISWSGNVSKIQIMPRWCCL